VDNQSIIAGQEKCGMPRETRNKFKIFSWGKKSNKVQKMFTKTRKCKMLLTLINSFISIPAFLPGRVAEAEAPGAHEVPHGL